MAPSLRSVLDSRDLGSAELHAARLDGEVFAVDECFAPVDEVEGPWLRASALALEFGTRWVVEAESAMWVLGLGEEPPRIHRLGTGRTERAKFAPSSRCVVREVRYRADDLQVVAGVRVTVAARILYDLALRGDECRRDAEAVLSLFDGIGEQCRQRIAESPNLPGKGGALARLALWRAGLSRC
jgi:hypothetical protein